MRWRTLLLLTPFCLWRSFAQEPAPVTSSESPATTAARADFQIRYVNGTNVYIDGGRDAGLAEGTKLVLKQDPTKPASDPANKRNRARHRGQAHRGLHRVDVRRLRSERLVPRSCPG